MVILGAGVGGTLVANRLAGKATVLVLNGFADHLNQPAFLYMPFERRVRTAMPARSLLRPGVQFRVAKATHIDREHRVLIADGTTRIPYDYLVIATGSKVDSNGIPGFKAAAHHFHCRYAADALRRELARFRRGHIVVGASSLPYKCPPSPHEFALLLDSHLRHRKLRDKARLTFVYPEATLFSKPQIVSVLEPLFRQRGIEIVTGFSLSEVRQDKTIVAADGRTIDGDLPVMVPPHTGAGFLRECGLANPAGWVPADRETLRVDDRVYALGDAADLPAPKSGAAAHFQADIVARNILSEIHGTAPTARYDGRVT